MDIETKIKQDMRKLGCLSHHSISLAFHLYLYLLEEKKMYDIDYAFNEEIDTLYLTARPDKNAKLNIYVPMPSSNDLDLEYIADLHENLCTPETGHIVNLAFITDDLFTTIYTFPKDMCCKQAAELAKLHLVYRDENLDNAFKRGPVQD